MAIRDTDAGGKQMANVDAADQMALANQATHPDAHPEAGLADGQADAPAVVGPDSHHPAAPGYSASKKAHLTRLRRIEGQVRGLQRMIENDEYCIDVLTQISAASSALKSLSLCLLEEHLGHCVAHAVQAGGEEADQKLTEANAAIARLVRS